jgi:hypothetical protein
MENMSHADVLIALSTQLLQLYKGACKGARTENGALAPGYLLWPEKRRESQRTGALSV